MGALCLDRPRDYRMVQKLFYSKQAPKVKWKQPDAQGNRIWKKLFHILTLNLNLALNLVFFK
jgi:hypothetical protein